MDQQTDRLTKWVIESRAGDQKTTTDLVWQMMSVSFISVSEQKNLGRYSVQTREGPELKENFGKEEFVHEQVTHVHRC